MTDNLSNNYLARLIEISKESVKELREFLQSYRFRSKSPRAMEKEIHSKADNLIIKNFKSSKIPLWLVNDSWGPEGPIIKTIKLANDPLFIVAFDSIDGSMNLVRKIPASSTFISILKNTKISSVKYSIVYNLFTGDRFEANEKNSTLNGKVISTSNRKTFDDAFISIDLSTPHLLELTNKLKNFLENFKKFKHSDLRRFGSNSLEACLVAMGALDAFIDLRQIAKPIDIVAGKHIVEKAGGKVVDPNRKAIDDYIFSEKAYSILFFANPHIEKKFFNYLQT